MAVRARPQRRPRPAPFKPGGNRLEVAVPAVIDPLVHPEGAHLAQAVVQAPGQHIRALHRHAAGGEIAVAHAVPQHRVALVQVEIQDYPPAPAHVGQRDGLPSPGSRDVARRVAHQPELRVRADRLAVHAQADGRRPPARRRRAGQHQKQPRPRTEQLPPPPPHQQHRAEREDQQRQPRPEEHPLRIREPLHHPQRHVPLVPGFPRTAEVRRQRQPDQPGHPPAHHFDQRRQVAGRQIVFAVPVQIGGDQVRRFIHRHPGPPGFVRQCGRQQCQDACGKNFLRRRLESAQRNDFRYRY